MDKYVLGQLKNTGAAKGVGTAVGLGFGVQAGRFLLVNIGQEVELFEGKWSCSGGEQMSVIRKTENSSTVFRPGRKMKNEMIDGYGPYSELSALVDQVGEKPNMRRKT